MKIDHGGRWETQYLHMLEPPLVEVGQRVAQGEQIGRVGSTGNSGAPHLHYEQRRGWEKVETHFDGVAVRHHPRRPRIHGQADEQQLPAAVS